MSPSPCGPWMLLHFNLSLVSVPIFLSLSIHLHPLATAWEELTEIFFGIGETEQRRSIICDDAASVCLWLLLPGDFPTRRLH